MANTHASEQNAKAQENKINNQTADNKAHEKVEDNQPNLTGAVAPKPERPERLAQDSESESNDKNEDS